MRRTLLTFLSVAALIGGSTGCVWDKPPVPHPQPGHVPQHPHHPPHPSPQTPTPAPSTVKRVIVTDTAQSVKSPYSETVFDLRALRAPHSQRLQPGVYSFTDSSIHPPRKFDVEVKLGREL